MNNSKEEPNMNNNISEIEFWISEYELRQFIDMATRWDIGAIYNTRTEKNPFGTFKYCVENAHSNYHKFSTQLNQKLIKFENWKAIEIDLKDRFIPMINQYLEWYKLNKHEFEKFEPYCPYKAMLSAIELTKREILKYFPDIERPTESYNCSHIFVTKNIFEKVIEYTKTIKVEDFIKEYSHLKKRLEAEKLIHKHTDTDFMFSIYDELKLITKEQFQEYLRIGKLESADRTKGKGRKEKFDNMFKSICP